VLRPAFSLGPRHRDIRVLPLLLDRVSMTHGDIRRAAALGQHLAGDPLSLPGSVPGPRVQVDLRVTRAHGDVPAEPASDICFHLMLRKGPPHPFGIRRVGQRNRQGSGVIVYVAARPRIEPSGGMAAYSATRQRPNAR
jgi:hypothetical protein